MRPLYEYIDESRGLFKDFNVFVNLCNDIADKLECTVKVKDYTKYGFKTVSIETDAFGGVFCTFNYDTNNGAITAWKGEKDETPIKNIKDIVPTVMKFYEKFGKARKTDTFKQELADFINSQY